VVWKLSNCDTTRKAGRSTLRQKLICRACERRDAARRVALRRVASHRIASPCNLVVRERDWLPSRNGMISEYVRAEGTDRSDQDGTRGNAITREKKRPSDTISQLLLLKVT